MSVRKIPRTKSAYYYPLLIKNMLQFPVTYNPEQEIVYRDKYRYTYRDFEKRVHKLANMLKSIGVKEGDVVAVMDWDSHRYLECFFAVPMIGAVLHTVNIRLSPEQLIYTINHAEDNVILVNSDFLPMLEAVKDKLKTVKNIILMTDEEAIPETSLELAGEYEELLNYQPEEYDFPDFDEDTMATLFYTTGTTGLPKGVYFSHRQLVLHTYGIISVHAAAGRSGFKVDNSDIYMPLTPMFHVHAWGFPYMFTLICAKQVYVGRYEPSLILKLVEKENVTFSHCVPTILHMILKSPTIKYVNLSNWKVVIGGSALSQGLCREAIKYGINIISGYGMSETCPVIATVVLKPHMVNWNIEEQIPIRCKTGIPLPNVLMELVDLQGNPVPHDGKSTGEVVVRAPWLTQGYLKDPEKSEELWRDGWLHTGDIGYIDEEGYLKVTDRLKDVIKTGGEWISSLELEDILSQHEAVSEAAVIGVPDEKWGERPLALVVLHNEFKGKVGEQAIKEHFTKYVNEGVLPRYGIPDKIEIVDEIPKTSVGKINKKEIRKRYI